MIRAAVFAALTVAIALASRSSLRHPGSHGFPRFFAWECMLALLLVVYRGPAAWFADPLSARQLASWGLLGGSLVYVVLGGRQLFGRGAVDAGARRDPVLFPFEQTTRLVTTGLYRYVRHPLYGSLLLLAWGIFLKRPTWVGAALAAAATLLLAATAAIEERENAAYFGTAYAAYRRTSRRFIPFVY